MSANFDLLSCEITVADVVRNPPPSVLYEFALRDEPGTALTDRGAMVALSGEKTGRTPKDKRLVDEPETTDDVWWGPVNIPLTPRAFNCCRQRAIDYLNTRARVYCVDGYAGWDPEHRLKVRVLCARAYHALFMRNMLVRPTAEQLVDFGEPDYVIYNAGGFPANVHTEGVTSRASVSLSFTQKQIVILGTEYAGEMKKGVFTLMNYLMPKGGALSMHCSATSDRETGEASVLFGLSGTGKTTLSADPRRLLIGDDEHVWTDAGLFNIEGGCYAKMIDLSPEEEPDIHGALTFGAVLENVVLDPASRRVDFKDTSITLNTRGSYPVEHIPNARIPCVGGHPKNVIFLTCDAFGVLPPVSRLSPEQAMYHFISGYTAKVAGTEMGVVEPEATFSPCFGGPFLVWHPTRYAELLAQKIRAHDAAVWLVNTGWSGGAAGKGGERMKLRFTRAIVDAIHTGALAEAEMVVDPRFGVAVPLAVPGVPSEILNPRNTWADKAAFDTAARALAEMFQSNFQTYAGEASAAVRAAGPRV